MLRIDELNDLGCCCFCSVQYVANGNYFEKNPEKIQGFMKAMRRATDFTIEHPDVHRPATHPVHTQYHASIRPARAYPSAQYSTHAPHLLVCADQTRVRPWQAAWKIMTRANPRLDNNLYAKIYQRTLPYFSRDLRNVDRDWEKVGQFCKHLGVLETEFDQVPPPAFTVLRLHHTTTFCSLADFFSFPAHTP